MKHSVYDTGWNALSERSRSILMKSLGFSCSFMPVWWKNKEQLCCSDRSLSVDNQNNAYVLLLLLISMLFWNVKAFLSPFGFSVIILAENLKGKLHSEMHLIYFFVNVHSPLQMYWSTKTNSFIFAIHWQHSGLRSNDE